jgi:hypothetical protein
LRVSQIFSLQSRLGINHLKLQNYSGTTRLKLRCWQFCWQSKTQKILPLSKIPLIIAVTNALSCSTSPAAVRPNPLTTAPVPFRKKARSSRAAFQMPNDRRAFRLRFRDVRYAVATFPPSLRLRFTFPFAEPQAEAKSK